MNKAFFLLFLCFAANASFAQEVVTELYYGPDVSNPTFQGGGMDKFHDYINQEFDFKKVTKSGKMVATFTIDVDGNLKSIRITQMIDVDSAAEMIRVLKKSPKWESAKRSGKPYSVEIKYPMVFK